MSRCSTAPCRGSIVPTNRLFSFQGHPEASPGPHDAAPLFDHFIELIELYRQSAK
ncbi:hypothetical protein AB6U14_17035 [Klebsiella pneumoniae]